MANKYFIHLPFLDLKLLDRIGSTPTAIRHILTSIGNLVQRHCMSRRDNVDVDFCKLSRFVKVSLPCEDQWGIMFVPSLYFTPFFPTIVSSSSPSL